MCHQACVYGSGVNSPPKDRRPRAEKPGPMFCCLTEDVCKLRTEGFPLQGNETQIWPRIRRSSRARRPPEGLDLFDDVHSLRRPGPFITNTQEQGRAGLGRAGQKVVPTPLLSVGPLFMGSSRKLSSHYLHSADVGHAVQVGLVFRDSTLLFSFSWLWATIRRKARILPGQTALCRFK